jgi:hypothetical protein
VGERPVLVVAVMMEEKIEQVAVEAVAVGSLEEVVAAVTVEQRRIETLWYIVETMLHD